MMNRKAVCWVFSLFAVFTIMRGKSFGEENVKMPDPIFYVSFNKTIDADIAGGSSSCVKFYLKDGNVAQPEFTDGVSGKALITGKAVALYASSGNINPDAGTVSLWIKPLNWFPTDDKRHGFFMTSHILKENKIYSFYCLYKYEKYVAEEFSNKFKVVVLAAKEEDGDTKFLSQDISIPGNLTDNWGIGSWHHLAYTYNRGLNEVVIYADGIEAVRRRVYFPDKIGEQIAVGTNESGEHETVLDELQIWDTDLSSKQIKEIYRTGRKLLEDEKQSRRSSEEYVKEGNN